LSYGPSRKSTSHCIKYHSFIQPKRNIGKMYI